MAGICSEEKFLYLSVPTHKDDALRMGCHGKKNTFCYYKYSNINFICKSQLGLSHHHSCVCASVLTVCILSYTHITPGLALKFAIVRPVLTPSPVPIPSNNNIICIQHSGTETITVSTSVPWL